MYEGNLGVRVHVVGELFEHAGIGCMSVDNQYNYVAMVMDFFFNLPFIPLSHIHIKLNWASW